MFSRNATLPALALCAFAPAASAQSAVLNAPVAPDAIYVVRTWPDSGVSIVDLNGFGGGTGDPTFDPTLSTILPGTSRYPFNPNVRYQGSLLIPPLFGPQSTLNGGSAGVFTLARDSQLASLHARAALVAPGDAMLGAPLDLVASNAPAPFGCDQGGGSLCAADALQRAELEVTPEGVLVPAGSGGTPVFVAIGAGNPISFAPHPNPPPIQGPPTCVSPAIRAIEPTSIETVARVGLANLLVPGDPFGVPQQGIPPTGLLARVQNAYFDGPGRPQPLIHQCPVYQVRQQVGHFLYVIDRAAHAVVAFHSNTMEELARIALPDPTELAMGPKLNLLAVSNRAADSVSFVDIVPGSPTFHQIVATTSVGDGPSGIAWQPDDEDVLVCNELDSSVSILSAQTLGVRRVVSRGLSAPFAIAVTPRQMGFGLQRAVYFAWILDRAGKLSLFESGPNTVNGWGYDEIVGRARPTFRNPRAMQPDHRDLRGGVWIAHEGQLDQDGAPTGLVGGAVTNVVLSSLLLGPQPLNLFQPPNLRGLRFDVVRSIGSDQLTGVPTDVAFDDLKNLGALPQPANGGPDVVVNGKNLVRRVGLATWATNDPGWMFVPVLDPATGRGRGVDVIALATGTRVDVDAWTPGVQSIGARGAALAIDYFRQ